jgi:hypothetical protein
MEVENYVLGGGLIVNNSLVLWRVWFGGGGRRVYLHHYLLSKVLFWLDNLSGYFFVRLFLWWNDV